MKPVSVRRSIWLFAVVLSLGIVLGVARPAGKVPQPPPATEAPAFGDFRIWEVRRGWVVLESPSGAHLLAREGTRVGARGDELISIGPDQLVLRRTPAAGAPAAERLVVLTWDAQGCIREHPLDPPREARVAHAGGTLLPPLGK